MSLEWEDKRGKGKQWKECDIGGISQKKRGTNSFVLAKGPFHMSYTF